MKFANLITGLKRSIGSIFTKGTSTFINVIGGQASSGQTVNQKTALRISAVYASVRAIAETVAILPFNVYKVEGGKRVPANDHPAFRLLRYQPNSYYNSFTFREMLMTYALLWGNGYALIKRDSLARPISIHILEPWNVQPVVFENEKFYRVSGPMKEPLPVRAEDMIHIHGLSTDGISGLSVIQEVAYEVIGNSLAAQSYAGKFFKNGTFMNVVFESDNPLNDENIKGLKQEIGSRSGDNAYDNLVLPFGIKMRNVAMPAGDAQFLETQKWGVEDIARIFRIPPHKIQNLERSTNNNIEHQAIEFMTDTISPWVCRIEAEMELKLFRSDEVGKYDVAIDMNSAMRGDVKTRARYYDTMMKWGVMCPNEVREREGMNPMEGGDVHLFPMNYTVDPVEKSLESPGIEE